MLTIGNIPLKNKVILAPMSGVSDLPFRRIALRYGVGLVVSEMVASEALCTGHPESLMRAEGEGIDLISFSWRVKTRTGWGKVRVWRKKPVRM